ADRADFNAAAREAQLHVTEDKKGFVAWRVPGGKSSRVLRPDLLRVVEENWSEREGTIGRWCVRIRVDGSPSNAPNFIPLVGTGCSDDVWGRVTTASRRLAAELAQGPGFVARIQSERWSSANEYLLAWADALEAGIPELALHGTIEVQTLSGQTIGMIVL